MLELERKFLLKNDSWKEDVFLTSEIEQGYISSSDISSTMVRIKDGIGYIIVKSNKHKLERETFEYEIDQEEARNMIDLFSLYVPIKKTRHLVDTGDGLLWEIDEFHEENEGLVVAEIEMKDENNDLYLPDWIGEEVTANPKYYNSEINKNLKR